MASASKQVIDAVAARLATGSVAGARVYADRAWPTAEADLPCWLVIADADSDEQIDPLTMHWPRQQAHKLPISLVGKVRATVGLDDALDAMLVDALGVLFDTQAHATLDPLNVQMFEVARRRRLVGDGEAATGQITVVLEARFVTVQDQPEAFA